MRLDSPTGPFGTTDYRIRLEAAPMDAQRTILHLGYSHGYGVRAKLAMQAYFNTLGRGKVGFTVVDKDAQGKPVYVSDLRGGLERNAMRYYASIESYLRRSGGAPAAAARAAPAPLVCVHRALSAAAPGGARLPRPQAQGSAASAVAGLTPAERAHHGLFSASLTDNVGARAERRRNLRIRTI